MRTDDFDEEVNLEDDEWEDDDELEEKDEEEEGDTPPTISSLGVIVPFICH